MRASRVVGLLFPGQGSQYVSMSKYLYDHYESAKRFIDQADQVVGYHLSKLMFEGPAVSY